MDIRQHMEHVKCNLCGADDFTVIYPAKYHLVKEQDLADKFKSSGDEILVDQMVKCKRCGLQYLTPRLKADLIFKGYSMGEDPQFVSQAKGREITFNHSLRFIEKFAKKGRILALFIYPSTARLPRARLMRIGRKESTIMTSERGRM